MTDPHAASPELVDRAQRKRFDLREAAHNLEKAIAGPSSSASWRDDVEDALHQLAEALEAHIDEVEAPDGLLAEIMEVAPHLASHVDVIEREHPQLTEAVAAAGRAIRPPLVDADPDPTDIRRKIMSLLWRLTVHRQRGADLVYDAYTTDISAGD